MSDEAPDPDAGQREVWALDAVGQAALVASGAVGSTELVEAALARVDANADLHATTVLFPERALDRAVSASGPFAGVPILLKDAGQELAATPLWMGTTVLRDAGYTSPTTTELAAALETLGFVIIGKAAVPELMSGISTEPPTGPPTGNPWALTWTVGGSSGGSAAAVAAGVVPIAHGSDSTGSLRYPASCCAVLTLKPSAGRVPSRCPAGVPNPGAFHADFVLARSSRDLRAVLGGVASPAGAGERPVGKGLARLGRLGVLSSMPFGLPLDDAVAGAVADVGDRLADVGYTVVPVAPDFLEPYGAVLGAEIPAMVDDHRAAVVTWIERMIGRPVVDGDLSPEIVDGADRGRLLPPGAGAAANERIRLAAAEAAGSWMSRVDGLVLPVIDPPWPTGADPPDGRLVGLLCSFANFAGQPAAVVPTVRSGVPVGVQIQGPIGTDELLLDALDLVSPTAPASPRLLAGDRR